MSNIYTLTQNQVKETIKLSLASNIPLYIHGQPATGKSSLVRQVANELGYHLIDLRLSQLTRYDLYGLPHVNKDIDKFQLAPLEEFPLEGEGNPNDKYIIFLDEFSNADKYTQASAYKLLLEREIGKYKLHPNTRIICAGNTVLDSQAANKLLSPIKSRVMHVHVEVNAKEFTQYVEDQVMLGEWSSYILGFINFKPEHINNFDSNTIDEVETFSSPRTLEFLSENIRAGLLQLPEETYENIIVGIIGESAGNDFNAYLRVFNELPTIQEIVNDPDNCRLPEDVGAQWALSTLLLQGITPQLTNQFARYIERITNEDIKVVIYRTLLRKCPQIIAEPLVQKSMGLLKVKLNQVSNP